MTTFGLLFACGSFLLGGLVYAGDYVLDKHNGSFMLTP
jgi:hypothetical protein